MQSLVKKATFTGSIALALAFQLPAQAVSLGTLTGVQGIDGDKTAAGAFVDFYNFGTSPNIGSTFGANSFNIFGVDPGIQSLALYVGTYTDAAQLAGRPAIASVTLPTDTLIAPGTILHSFAASTGALPVAQQYTLAITGNATAPSGYTAFVALAPIPEPETYALMLAGMGLVGALARRRRARL